MARDQLLKYPINTLSLISNSLCWKIGWVLSFPILNIDKIIVNPHITQLYSSPLNNRAVNLIPFFWKFHPARAYLGVLYLNQQNKCAGDLWKKSILHVYSILHDYSVDQSTLLSDPVGMGACMVSPLFKNVSIGTHTFKRESNIFLSDC